MPILFFYLSFLFAVRERPRCPSRTTALLFVKSRAALRERQITFASVKLRINVRIFKQTLCFFARLFVSLWLRHEPKVDARRGRSQDTFKGCKQHSSGKLKLPSSQPTLISRRRCEKYSSKLDISRSFVCIFITA